jgi:hypothetical protein
MTEGQILHRIEAAVQAERARIVEHLRSRARSADRMAEALTDTNTRNRMYAQVGALLGAADAIERGEG